MLWIHGGAFTLGDTLGYDGSVLATEGNVLVVTAAYRLGFFGFLSANNDDLKGNYGLMDQIEAMKWVNKNIARYDNNICHLFLLLHIGMSRIMQIVWWVRHDRNIPFIGKLRVFRQRAGNFD